MSNLILTRRIGETLVIGDDVTVTVVAINGNAVRIAINAPADVEIDREEIRQRKIEEQYAAEAELIKGLYVLEFRERATGNPLLWIATTRSIDHDPIALALFHSECHGYALDDITISTVWDPYMVYYHGTELERDQDTSLYDALLDECKAYEPPTPFVVPMPATNAAATAEDSSAVAALKGAA